MIDRKDPLNLHSFVYKELLKKKENTNELKVHPLRELIKHPLLNNVNSIHENFVYADTDSVKEKE